MGLDVQLKNGLVLAFPTPILRQTLEDADRINKNLKKTILERAAKEESAARHLVGGWRSRDDLLGWPGKEADELKGVVNRAIARLTQLTMGAPGKAIRGEITAVAWANVCRKGDYIRQHIHPYSNWSGVYFVSGEKEVADNPDSGVLELIDPRGGAGVLETPGNPFGGTFRIKPAPGLLVVHPGWLAHFVNPYGGRGERVSVGFNVFIKGVRLVERASEQPA